MGYLVHLSLVIPAYNEADRIGATLEEVAGYLRGRAYASEIIVVDDGSSDGTADIVRGFQAVDGRVRLVALPRNEGKGAAVRAGMWREARGAYRVFYDADASTPIRELEKLWPLFDAGADIVIGSRALPDSDVQVRQAWYRQSMGRVFNLVLRGLKLSKFRDTQCGFKGFSAAACEVVFPRQQVSRFGFDAELLYIAALHGLRVEEVPVQWLNCPRSRVYPVADSWSMFSDLLRIRVRGAQGKYR